MTKLSFNVKIPLLSKPDDCGNFIHEESPGFTGQGCRVTPGGGDSKDSATEIDCQFWRWWKGEVRAHQRCGDVTAM